MKRYLVGENESILSCLEKINKLEKKILFITNSKNVLKGSLTDGDLRRAFLKKVKISDSVTSAMNKKPLFVLEGNYDQYDLEARSNELNITMIPIVNKSMVVRDIIDADIKNVKSKFKKRNNRNFKLKKALLMAGGEGKRLLPLTQQTPKPMLLIDNKPILEWQINYLKSYDIDQVYISVNYKKEKIKKYFGNGEKFNVNIKYLEEKKKLGTAGPLALLSGGDIDDLLVLNGDTITDFDLAEFFLFHKNERADMTVGGIIHTTAIPYGVIENKNASILDITEKPKHSYLCNAGIYLLSSAAIKHIPNNKEFNMDELIKKLIKIKCKVNVLPVIEELTDIGTVKQLEEARHKIEK